MILDIKRKKKEKRVQLLGGLIGICVALSMARRRLFDSEDSL